MGTLFHSDASPEFARQFAATLARVHSVDLPRAGLLEHLNWGSERNPVRAMVDHFYQRYRERLSPVAHLGAMCLDDAARGLIRSRLQRLTALGYTGLVLSRLPSIRPMYSFRHQNSHKK